MAKYQIQSIEIGKIKNGVNKDKEYMVIQMTNVLAPLDGAIKSTEFNETIINLYKPFADKIAELPNELKFVSGHFCTWAPPKECIPFNKIYVTEGTHRVNGTDVPHKNGDTIVDRFGQPRLYDSVVVFCRYYMDPDFPGVPQYYKGNNPIETGQRYFDAFCKRISNSTPQASTNDPNEDAGAIAAQPTTTEKRTPIGYDPKTGQPIYAD